MIEEQAQEQESLKIVPVSLIIPFLNEETILPEFFAYLEKQIVKPAEVIFVNSGSTDNSSQVIQDEFKKELWDGVELNIYNYQGLYPGAARNRGIAKAKNQLIAFLDVGVNPYPVWLSELWNYYQKNDSVGVFGICTFFNDSMLGTSICALSNGVHGRAHVLPNLLIEKDVFDEIGGFPEGLRSAEDILWRRRFNDYYGLNRIAEKAIVNYTHYPETMKGAVRKWYLYAVNTARAQVHPLQVNIYLAFLAINIILLAIKFQYWLIFFGIYLISRGILDPIRRSKYFFWWGKNKGSFFMAIIMGALIDFAKIFGFLKGLYLYFFERKVKDQVNWKKQGKKLKILHVITTIDLGGAENHLMDLIKGQVQRGHKVSVAFLKGNADHHENYNKLGVEVLDAQLKFYGDIFPVFRILKFMKTFDPDIVHAHMPPAELYTRLSLLMYDKRQELYITKHNDEPFFNYPGEKLIGNWVAKRARKMIGISTAVEKYVYKRFPTAQRDGYLKTIYYGLESKKYDDVSDDQISALKKEWGVDDDTYIIGTVARLTRQKSLDTLLEAYAKFREGHDGKSKLVFVGDGELREELQAYAKKLGIFEHTLWCGKRSDIPVVMKTYDVFTLPSIYEGFGLVLLESMAAGKPIIASRVSAIPETIKDGETGILIEKRSVEQLTNALKFYANVDNRQKHGKAGYERLNSVYSVDKMIDDTIDFYRD